MLIATILSLCLSTPTETLAYGYAFDGLDVLNGDSQSFEVEPFPVDLGTLVKVQIVIEAYRQRQIVRLTNRSGNYYPGQHFASGIGLVPWIHSGGHEWSMLSFGSTIMPAAGFSGETRVIPPYSVNYLNRFNDSDHFTCGGTTLDWGPFYFNLTGPYDPSVHWWTDVNNDGPITLEFCPTWWCGATLFDDDHNALPWPGACDPMMFAFGMTYRVEYTYEP